MGQSINSRLRGAWDALHADRDSAPRDSVRVRGGLVIFDFAATGRGDGPSYVRVDSLFSHVAGLRSSAAGANWILEYGDAGHGTAVIDVFPTQEQAKAAQALGRACVDRIIRKRVRVRRATTALACVLLAVLFVPWQQHRGMQGETGASELGQRRPQSAIDAPPRADAPPLPRVEPSLSAPALEAAIPSDPGQAISEYASAGAPATVKVDLARIKAMAGFDGGGVGPDIWVLVDPECPYCRALEKDLDSAVAGKKLHVHYVPVPIKGGNSGVLIAEVFCNTSPAQAWKSAMFEGYVDTDISKKDALAVCANKTMSNLQTFIDLKMTGTPTIVAANGTVVTGAIPMDKLVAWAKANS